MAISFAKLHVLDPSRVARRLLWYVLSIGVVSRDEPEDHVGMDKAGLFLFRVKSGSGTLELPGARLDLTRGSSWWLVDLAKPRRYVPPTGTRLVTMGVRFSGAGIDAWRDEAFHGRAAVVFSSAHESMTLRKAADELLRLTSEISAAEWRVHEILSGILGLLLNTRQMLDTKQPEPHSATRRVIDAVQANPGRDWLVAELCTIAGISYSSLAHSLQSVTG